MIRNTQSDSNPDADEGWSWMRDEKCARGFEKVSSMEKLQKQRLQRSGDRTNYESVADVKSDEDLSVITPMRLAPKVRFSATW